MFSFAIFVQKLDFEQLQFRRMGVALTEFYLFKLSSLPIYLHFPYGKVILKLQKLRWRNIFTIEMMIFDIFIEQMDLSNHSVRSWL